MIDCPPKAELLFALAAQPLGWEISLKEWIDNCLDAGAYQIEIEIARDHLSVKDNGKGCEHPEIMVTLGSHTEHSSTKLGRYGIGAKDAALWAGGEKSNVAIKTVHAKKLITLTVNWADYANTGWRLEDPQVRDATQEDKSGTLLRIYPIVKKPPRDWDDLLADLGYTYSPAIKKGAQITLKGPGGKKQPDILQRWELPKFEGPPVDQDIDVGGKLARVYCGVVADGVPNPRAGLTYSHGFRVIKPACSLGCGKFSISRICGFIELDGSWRLAKNKNAILNPEDLYVAVEEACLPVLRRAEELGKIMQQDTFESQLTAMLREAMAGKRKAKRDPGNTHGTVLPKNTGRQHHTAEKEQPGDRFGTHSNAVRVIHAHLGELEGCGQVKFPNVVLNLDNEFIQQTYRAGDLLAEWAVVGLLLAGETLFEPESQLQFRFSAGRDGKDIKEFSKLGGAILAGSPLARERKFEKEEERAS